jgi:hypothetical protein
MQVWQVLLDEHASLAALMLFLGLLSFLAASFIAQHAVQIINNTTTNELSKCVIVSCCL